MDCWVFRWKCEPSYSYRYFSGCKKDDKDFSFATVYNTLDVLVKQGVVKQIKTDEKSCRFDPNTNLHGHFYCKKCGRLFDIEIEFKTNYRWHIKRLER